MAQNVVINTVTYQNVPQVQIPKSGGGTASFYDIADATIDNGNKLLDGVTDIFFGNLIDRTHSKMGKARPWMLWSYVGNALALVATFAIPESVPSGSVSTSSPRLYRSVFTSVTSLALWATLAFPWK